MYYLLILASIVTAVPYSSRMPSIAGFRDITILPSRGGNSICASGTISVIASAANIKTNFPLPQNQSQVTEAFVNAFSAGSTASRKGPVAMQNVSGTYDIGASLCVPVNGSVRSTVQVLTHGVGFDRYYWDFAPGYSYVDYAAQQGYASFSYDRLGVGKSAKPDPITEVQSPLETAILAQLIRLLRSTKTFTQVVGVGHSFGSLLTQGIPNIDPKLLDAAVLTGFSGNSAGAPAFIAANNFAIASQIAPYRFANLSNGYVVASSAVSTQYAFFKAPNFDPDILAATDAQKSTLAFGEFLSMSNAVRQAPLYTGPVAIVNGLNDLPFCNGNCTYMGDVTSATRVGLYPAARNVTGSPSTLNVPLTGHAINMHYSAPIAYQFIQNFIKAAGY